MTTTIINGPPGTGKTFEVGRRVRACVEAGDKPLVCSLTRTAAQEIVSRNLPVDREQVGTLHAHAYRAIGSPPVVASRIAEWNSSHPALALSGGTVDPDEPLGEQRQSTAYGDEACNDYHLLRARMVARDLWPERVRSFAKQFEEWKDAREVVDFTDMIDRAMPHGAPGSPQIIFADECQDHSRLELALLKRWAQNAGQLVIVGDPHQSLYGWRGAHPQMFSSTKVPDSHRHILNQSYRVPRAVHAAAIRWVSKLSDYAPIDYHPRNEDGTAGLLDTSWRWPEPVLDLAERHLDDGQSVMICASCGYLLGPTLAALRLRGLPYSNPWRRRRGDWNPIRVGGRGTSMGERIAAFLRPLSDDDSGTSFDFGDAAGGSPWTIEDVHKWASIVKADGLLGRGCKKQIADDAKLRPGAVVTPQLLFEWFLPGVLPFLDEMMAGGVSVCDALSWLEANLLGTKKPAASFPLTVVRRRGRDGLNEPRLHVGTIHSFKGAESDVVILYPDLSPQGIREWTTEGEGKDSVIRMFYVGLTRARHSVYVCRAASGMAANVWESLN